MRKILVILLCCWGLTACAVKVGSQKWCENLVAKPKGDWTLNEAKIYATHCIFRRYGEE